MLQTIQRWLDSDSTGNSTLYSNRTSRTQDQQVAYNYAGNPMDTYVKNGFSIISFLICVLLVNTLLK